MGLWLPFEGVQGANPLHNLEFAPAEHMGQIWQWTRTQLQLQLQPEPEDPSSAGACVQRLTLKLQPRCMPPPTPSLSNCSPFQLPVRSSYAVVSQRIVRLLVSTAITVSLQLAASDWEILSQNLLLNQWRSTHTPLHPRDTTRRLPNSP